MLSRRRRGRSSHASPTPPPTSSSRRRVCRPRGRQRALFVVVAGEIELSKPIDGIESPIGGAAARHRLRRGADHLRHPDAGDRAAPPSRRACCASTRAHYYALAAASPRRSPQAIGALARERIGGLQGIAAEAAEAAGDDASATAGTPPATTCGASCRATRSPSTGLTPDDPDSPSAGTARRRPRPTCPALRLADGTDARPARSRASSPSALGLQTTPRAPTTTR